MKFWRSISVPYPTGSACGWGPNLFESICVDAVVKMYRRTYYEGISNEGAANISTTFVDDVLAEYAQEIGDWKTQQANTGGSDKVVRFL